MLAFNQEITSAGGTFTYDPQAWGGGSAIINIRSSSSFSLANDFILNIASSPNIGETLLITTQFEGNNVNLNGHKFTLNGQEYPQYIIDNPLINVTQLTDTLIGLVNFTINDYFYSGIPGNLINAGTINTSSLGALASGKIILGDAGGQASFVIPSGDVTISNTGVNTIANSAITNAKVSASAAIALSKLAALTASKVAVTDGSGIITTASQLSPALGGTGQDLSASTGFVKVSAGTVSAGSITEVIPLQVSFESGYLGDFKVLMPYAGTVTGIYAYATKVIAGTDNGTITAKNNGGTSMTSGVVTFTASDARGTAYSVTPSANNTFVAGDLLTFTTAKTTAGGVVQLSITVTRTS
jgi:hypothetical protein